LRSTKNTEREYFVYSPAVVHTVATLTGDIPTNVGVKSTNLYEAFGNVVKLDAGVWDKTDGPTSGASDNNRLANTKERDASIGLDNHGMRYYDPEIGRYTTRDPIGYGDGPNVYLSVRNNLINAFDPLGLNGEQLEVADEELPTTGADYVAFEQAVRDSAVGEGKETEDKATSPEGKTVVFWVDTSVLGAKGAAGKYQKTLQKAGYSTEVIETTSPLSEYEKPLKRLSELAEKQQMGGFVVVAHGNTRNTGNIFREDLEKVAAIQKFDLLAMQSCLSYNVANPDGYYDEAGDLMATGGQLVVNYRYSTVPGNVGNFNKAIRSWASGKPYGKQAADYHTQIRYNAVADASRTLRMLWDYGWAGVSGNSGRKEYSK